MAIPDGAQFLAGRLTARYYKVDQGVVYVWRSIPQVWERSTLSIEHLQKSYNYEPIGHETAVDF